MIKNCYILIGLPGSGKSTLARRILDYNQSYYVIVSTDQIREKLYGESSIQGYWPSIEQQVLSQIKQALLADKSVIYDATNYNQNHRIDLLNNLAKLPPAQWIGVYLTTPLAQCKVWNKQRARQVIETVIENMNHCLHAAPPTVAEGFSKIFEIPQDLAEFVQSLQ
jgi:predicted kinase